MENSRLSPITERILDSIPEEEKDNVYRALWYEYVKEDVEGAFIDHESLPYDYELNGEQVSIIEQVAERYVYDGDYDCNLTYWENLDNLIEDQLLWNE